MRFSYHIAVSVPFAGAIYAVSKSWEAAAASLVSGVFVDLDHLFDYMVEYGTKFDLKNFLSSFPEGRYKRIFIPLHAWEWLISGALVAWATGWNACVVGLLLGWGYHLILDQMFNGVSTWGYSFFWRCATKFDPKRSFSRKNIYAWNR